MEFFVTNYIVNYRKLFENIFSIASDKNFYLQNCEKEKIWKSTLKYSENSGTRVQVLKYLYSGVQSTLSTQALDTFLEIVLQVLKHLILFWKLYSKYSST